MTDVNYKDRLLLLHYFRPTPAHQFQKILKEDPFLERLFQFTPIQLSSLLYIPLSHAKKLHQQLHQYAQLPIAYIYEQQQIHPILITEDLYPRLLKQLRDPPLILYTKGDYSLLSSSKKIAIIGSRKATAYSLAALEQIIPPLVSYHLPIVSGLAKGADTMAHELTIRYGGKTIAVLGHGFNYIYPSTNQLLAQEIAENHLLLTEYPPYVKPARWTFPMRNRMISGISEAVIVTEAAQKSGTMSTIDHALEHGKDVYAVPGSISSALSIGPNDLIFHGATPIWNGYQVVGNLKID